MYSPASSIDHTLLKADCSEEEIANLCEDAVEYGFATVCIPPVFVQQASRCLYGSDVEVCTVVGFPLGYQMTKTKVFEAGEAVESGASEIDMVINLAAARAADYKTVEDEISQVVKAAGRSLVKVIIECCLFDDEVKARLADVVVQAGADFVKTSTGFFQSGATVEDVKLLSATVSGRVQVKASGGIRDWDLCQKMLSSGASRIGTSSGVTIMHQWRESIALP